MTWRNLYEVEALENLIPCVYRESISPSKVCCRGQLLIPGDNQKYSAGYLNKGFVLLTNIFLKSNSAHASLHPGTSKNLQRDLLNTQIEMTGVLFSLLYSF